MKPKLSPAGNEGPVGRCQGCKKWWVEGLWEYFGGSLSWISGLHRTSKNRTIGLVTSVLPGLPSLSLEALSCFLLCEMLDEQ